MANEDLVKFHRTVVSKLKEFLGVPKLKYADRKEAANAVANYFRQLSPKTPAEYQHFYDTCDDYIFENAYCNEENSCVQRTKKIYSVLQNYGVKTIVEFGVGVGTYAICLSQKGFDISVAKTEDLAFTFFLWRTHFHQIPIKLISHPQGKYDCAMFIDVIEHLINPFDFLSMVMQHTDLIIFTHGFGVHREDMGGYPQHFDYPINTIRKFLEKNGFQKQKINLPFPPHVYKRTL